MPCVRCTAEKSYSKKACVAGKPCWKFYFGIELRREISFGQPPIIRSTALDICQRTRFLPHRFLSNTLALSSRGFPQRYRHMRPAKDWSYSEGCANSTKVGRRFLLELAQAERMFCGLRRINVAWNDPRTKALRASKATFNSLHNERLP